jgi:carbamoyl-phosphate synthase large subunit
METMQQCHYLKEKTNIMRDNFNILFTSSGRRVSLIRKFKDALFKENMNGKIVTTDLKNTAPTSLIGDKHFIVSKVNNPSYITELLEICRQEDIKLLIPLIDSELIVLAKNKQLFEGIGVRVLISSEELIEISCNKVKSYKFFITKNIPTPKVYKNSEIEEGLFRFPLLIKPLDGSSSKGVTVIRNEKELKFFKEYIPNAMIQEFISGDEYTVDVIVDFEGNIKTIVPRLRIETRAGEVSKGKTVRDIDVIKAVEDLVKVLPGPIGCITIQCFKQRNGEIKFIEINPRFGGGVPLSIQAGANIPLWIIKMCKGEKIIISEEENWRENIMMLRYDEAIFMEN